MRAKISLNQKVFQQTGRVLFLTPSGGLSSVFHSGAESVSALKQWVFYLLGPGLIWPHTQREPIRATDHKIKKRDGLEPSSVLATGFNDRS